MSKGMKLYTLAVAALVVFILFKWLYVPAEVRDLNQLLRQDPQLASYPYPFRVVQVTAGTAVMSSPRSASVSVPEIIAAIDPALASVSITDQRYLDAQQQLANLQSYARSLILAAPGISNVQWQLDEAWLTSHGIVLVK